MLKLILIRFDWFCIFLFIYTNLSRWILGIKGLPSRGQVQAFVGSPAFEGTTGNHF